MGTPPVGMMNTPRMVVCMERLGGEAEEPVGDVQKRGEGNVSARRGKAMGACWL